MKYFVKIVLVISIALYFSGCALEGAPVIGPAKGYVFYDKGNYSDGWRYLECAPEDIGEFNFRKKAYDTVIEEANILVSNFYYGGYKGWRIPNDRELNMMTKVMPKIIKGYLSSEKTAYAWSDGGLKWEKGDPIHLREGGYTIWAVREF